MNYRQGEAQRKCAEWLAYCVSIGWPKSTLDDLEALWWKYHNRETGELMRAADTEKP